MTTAPAKATPVPELQQPSMNPGIVLVCAGRNFSFDGASRKRTLQGCRQGYDTSALQEAPFCVSPDRTVPQAIPVTRRGRGSRRTANQFATQSAGLGDPLGPPSQLSKWGHFAPVTSHSNPFSRPGQLGQGPRQRLHLFCPVPVLLGTVWEP